MDRRLHHWLKASASRVLTPESTYDDVMRPVDDDGRGHDTASVQCQRRVTEYDMLVRQILMVQVVR